MNHPDIPKQNGNWSELYDKFPAEYDTNTTVRGRDYKMKVEKNTSYVILILLYSYKRD